MVIICFFIFPMALGALLSYAAVAPGSQLLGRTLVRGDGISPKIALTFDDGPGEATPLILDILKDAGIRATFFLCGQNAERFPELARRIADEGHEIGNHTYSHPHMAWKTPGRFAWEITRAQDAIERAAGHRPKLFRPPYGERWFGLFPVLMGNGLATVMWSVSGADWRFSAARIAKRVMKKVKPGSIILLHDGMPPGERGNRLATIEALRNIIPPLMEQYRFVTVSELV
jgi:peptidoglycan/xylan/chitin deacetylase (PgdA/CDA1 family)